jgi:EAL domain-containing protein (putative c-di-GMP-specific phosphodiesterase class I)
VNEPFAAYHERLDEISAQLVDRGSLGLLVVDATPLAAVEYEYGSEAYELVRQRLFRVFGEQRGRDYRGQDLIVLDEPRGLRFLIFLERKRRQALPITPADVRAARSRIAGTVVPNLARTAFPYLKPGPRIELGHAVALQNPLVHSERIIRRAVQEAIETGSLFRRMDELSVRERLQDVIVRDRLVTAYQPIQRLSDRKVLGYEALARGARGSGFETADQLFESAERHELLIELDRLCRGRALLHSSRLPSDTKLFINTLPATIRDPQFRGRPLITFLERAKVDPSRIVIEITEKLVIENYGLFREAMAYFTDLGVSFAVDDVGAGYSGLESIASLKPAFLKIDIALVRDVHVSVVNREMVKAIIALGRGTGATVIAEGIHNEAEADALAAMGIEYGQGFFLARPETGPDQQ